MSGFPYNAPSFVSRPAGHAVAVRNASGRIRPEETQNAQDEDQIGRKKALPLHGDWKDQDRAGLQAPSPAHEVQARAQGIERRSVRVRNPARQALDALRLR